MNGKYRLILKVWPYSLGIGAEAERAGVAPNERTFGFSASDFDDAYRKAKLIQQGVGSHSAVWQVPIVSLEWTGS